MDLKKNIAAFLRAFLKKNHLSMAKLQDLTRMSRNTLYDYRNARGNPSVDTIQYIAAQLNVDPMTILMGVYDPENGTLSVLLLNTVRGVAGLTREERQKVIKLFIQELLKLWDME